jgi:hypothetical protein
MKKSFTILYIFLTYFAFAQEKEINGSIYKNSLYVETIKSLMNSYKTNSIKRIKNEYEKISAENIVFRDALNNMNDENPLGKKMDLNEEMENMSKLFETYEIVSIKELGYPDHLDYKDGNDLVLSWWQFNWKNKISGNVGPIHLMVGHFFNQNDKIIGETYYLNPSTFPK